MTKTLLITDDALIVREMIKDIAQSAGWTVVGEATNGQMAVDMYRQLKPDLCTLDLVMPKFDGLFALRGIKECDPDAKVVVISALEQKNILQDAFRLGAADFVVKPFDKNSLTSTLEQFAACEV